LHTRHYFANTRCTHGIIAHMISHRSTTFHAKQDLTQTHVFNFLIMEPFRRKAEHTSTHVFCNTKRDST